MAFGNTFHFADLLHCSYLTKLFPKRWITSYSESHLLDEKNVNLLNLVGELALFSHRGPLNKLCSSALNGTSVARKVLFFSYCPLTFQYWAIFSQLVRKESSLFVSTLQCLYLHVPQNLLVVISIPFYIIFPP